MELMRRISRVLLLAGAGLCFVGVFGLVSGFFIRLPNAAVGFLTLAIPVATGGALLVSGALLGRAAKRREKLLSASQPAELPGVGREDNPPGIA